MISDLKKLQKFWHIACLSDALGPEPLARSIADQPVVLFRDAAGRAQALLDRCCHRYLPLSFGKVTPKGIRCNYHGWEFSTAGKCIRIPGQPPENVQALPHCIPTFAVREEDGLIWVYPSTDESASQAPFHIPHDKDGAYDTLRIDFGSMEAPVDNVIDNFMDSLHPPFVHPGLIYSDEKRNLIEIGVRACRTSDGYHGVEGCYLGEPAPTEGLIGRLFAKRGAAAIHEERYLMPCLTQAEYKVGETTHLLSTHVFTPETPTRTRMYLILRTKSRLPKFMTRPILRFIFTRLFRQDIVVLEKQHRAMDRPLPKASSELDYLSLTTVHFLQQLAAGESPEKIEVKPQRYKAFI
jgi:phenylpropionate dioxygenase-like ring-hydroxylating dioxygenase large terminal subunit